MKNSDFYNILADDYDEMIDFEKSLKNKLKNFQLYIKPFYKTALDLGCGSGADSIALYKLGLEVDAIDHSQSMIDIAKQNAIRNKSKINFNISQLPKVSHKKRYYDIIVSLGNTIANISYDGLNSLLDNIKGKIDKQGSILFQIINFDILPKSGEIILNKFENETISIVRKYIIHSNYIDFLITKQNKLSDEKSEIITKLYPHSSTIFKSFAVDNNLKFDFYGSMEMEPYQKNKSKNLVILLNN